MTIAGITGALRGITLLVVFIASPALAFNEPTHDLINRQAVQFSTVDNVLKRRLGLVQGLGTSFTNREGARKDVAGWLGEGGIREDQGNFGDFLFFLRGRLLRHFHDPLQPWDTAGLQIPLLPIRFESAVRWMQRADQASQAVGGNWSWQGVRQHYLTAVTSSNLAIRDQEFVSRPRISLDTSLGGMMLLQGGGHEQTQARPEVRGQRRGGGERAS